MKYLILLIMFFSFGVLADESVPVEWTFGQFFTRFHYFYEYIFDFIFEVIPQTINDLKVYMAFWLMRLYLQFKLTSIEMCFTLANLLLSDFGFTTLFDSALSSLPSDIRALISQYGLIRAVNIIIEAYVTRFVLSLGWF